MDWHQEERLRQAARLALRLGLGRRLPVCDGTLTLRGPEQVICIRRDAFGVPTIEATSEHDIFFGLGFCHAQDRGAQLELTLRAVRGTLSEVSGEAGLPLDRLSRRIGFRRAAETQLAAGRPEVKRQLEAYASGINAGFAHGAAKPPHELALLGTPPSRWEPADCQAVSVLLCFALASNWDVELLRLETLERDGRDALLAIDAPYPDDLPTSADPSRNAPAATARLIHDLEALRSLAPLGAASNAWAIGPDRSASGRPILSADPHLPPEVPVHWYLAHLVCPDFRATGASFVGIPGFAIGHNEHCAWAVTAAHADNTDLFIEELSADGRGARRGVEFKSFPVRREVIHVKGRALPVVEEVLVTNHGPLIGSALGARNGISIAATWLAPKPYTGLYRAHRARNRDEFDELFREASTSSVNVIYADSAGHIGWRLGVALPLRKSGFGTLPRPACDETAGFDGEVPFEQMPVLKDPKQGFVCSANNAPSADPDAPFCGIDWLDGYRQKRLIGLLSSRGDWTLTDSQALQRDVKTLVWDELREHILSAPPVDDDTSLGLELLAGWDGQLAADSIAASVWVLAMAGLMTRMLRKVAPRSAGRALGAGFLPDLPHTTIITRRMAHLSGLIRRDAPGYFEEGWPAATARALGDAVRKLRDEAGEVPAGWCWGERRPLRLSHPFAKSVSQLDYAFGLGPIPFGGDATTLMQGTPNLVQPLRGPVGVPNLRVTIDVGRWENSRYCLLAGQSGNPLSPHHADQRALFGTEGFSIAWTDQQARASAIHTLTLRPLDQA